jgi:polysaccharide pyruvyl transferase WcaK-like protein
LNKTINKYLTRFVLNRVDVITVRDENSIKELERLKVKKPKIELTADAALTLESVGKERIESILKAEGIDDTKSLIGFSIRQWGQDMEYLETIAKVADIAYKKYNLVPVFIVMQKDNDLKISKSIIKKMESDAYIIKDSYSPKEILGVISKLELLVGMRLHALIFASMSAVPCIGIVYEQKVEGFINYVRQVSAGSVSQLKTQDLSQILDEVYQDKKILKEFLLSIRTQLKDKSIQNAKLALQLLDKGKRGK